MFSRIRSSIFAANVFLTLLIPVNILGQAATVDWTDVHQQMDGWGGEDWQSAEGLASAQAALLFSASSSIGLNIIRTGNYACPNTGACPVSTANIPDLQTLQYAVANGAAVELSLQSPPASMKVSGMFTDGTGGINTAYYTAYAIFIVDWIELLQTNGVPVAYLDVQNEPDQSSSSLGACIWTAAQFDTFIGTYLGPAMELAGLTTKIMFASVSGWFNTDLTSTCLTDSTCAQYVSIVSAHGYGSGSKDSLEQQRLLLCSAYSCPVLSSGKAHLDV